jgi:hypothetical protein
MLLQLSEGGFVAHAEVVSGSFGLAGFFVFEQLLTVDIVVGLLREQDSTASSPVPANCIETVIQERVVVLDQSFEALHY